MRTSPRTASWRPWGRPTCRRRPANTTLADRDYPEAERGLRAIQEGHRQLQERLDRLSSKEARASDRQLIQDLRASARTSQAAQAW